MPMQDRKVLLQAHQLMTRRASLALLCGEPDSPNQPLRRMNSATVTGIMVGVIAAAVFGVLGLLAPTPASGLTKAGTLVLDQDTATSYVPCQSDKLCPTLNYVSALLALDTSSVDRVTVHQKSLAGYQIGPTIGIAGLPPDLPTPADLVQGPWSVCTANGQTALVGGASTGGAAVAQTQAVLVAAGGSDWVLWSGERLAVVPQVMEDLFPDDQPTTVPAGWLDALPQGPDFAAPAIAGITQTVTEDGQSLRVGQVFFQVSPAQYFVVEADGRLAQISPTMADLLKTTAGEPALSTISNAEATAELSGMKVSGGGLPFSLPRVVSQTATLCTVYGAGLERSLTTGGTVPAGATATTGSAGVNDVWLPSEHGALVGAAPSVDQPSTVTAWFLVYDGQRFALRSAALAAVLGYNLQVSKAVLPASVVDLLPQGPVLDQKAAADSAG
jgi:type VII secretion protein EccB